MNFALVGYGYWGKHYARLIFNNSSLQLKCIVDSSAASRQRASSEYPGVSHSEELQTALERYDVDAVIICTPVQTHYDLAKVALKNDKHVLCEKILSNDINKVHKLIDLSRRRERILDVGYTFLHNSIVLEIRNLISGNALGDMISISFKRMGYGPIRNDVDVVDDLIAHDLSMLLFWKFNPLWVQAAKCMVFDKKKADVASIVSLTENNTHLTFNVSWLHPLKQRMVEIVGSKGMLIFDDVALHEKLKIISIRNSYYEVVRDFGSFQYSVKSGDISIPNIQYKEPLSEQLDFFVSCVKDGANPFYHEKQQMNIQIAQILQAIHCSSENEGKRIYLSTQ